MPAYISQQERLHILAYCRQVAINLKMADLIFDLDTDELDDSLVVADFTIESRRVRLTDQILQQILEHMQNNSINFGLFVLYHELGHYDFFKNSSFFRSSNFFSERHADNFAVEQLCLLYDHSDVQEFLKSSFLADPTRGNFFAGNQLGRKGYQGYDKLLRYSQYLQKKACAKDEPLQSLFFLNSSI